MRIIAKRTLREFWLSSSRYEDAKGSLEAWHDEVKRVDWSNPQDVKAQFGTASILKDSRVVFNIHGNKYRLVVKINYPYKIVYIRFVGTHEQYDEADVENI
jgi:mRNA interferase HigB